MHSIIQILDEATDSAGPDLISLADLKLALGITDDSQDATLQAAITFQSRITRSIAFAARGPTT